MPNPRLAARYAKSLIDLSQEKNQLEDVHNDMLFLQQLNKGNKDFVNLLKSPVVNAGKKQAIVDIITKDKISVLTGAFIKLLILKNREEDLPEIVFAFIQQYNNIKGIHRLNLTTAVDISDDLKNAIVGKVKAATSIDNIELHLKTDNSIIGGFILEFDNNLVDASVLRDLKEISKQFKERNVFIQNIR